MGEILLSEPLASAIRRDAETEGLTVEAFLESALRHYRFEAQRRKIASESSWWWSVEPEVRSRYAGEFVAIHEHAVVDHDRDEEAMRRRIRSQYSKAAILITPAEYRRSLRLVSTRLQRA